MIVGPGPDGAPAAVEVLDGDLAARAAVPLPARLHFTGPLQDIPQVLAALDVSVGASASPWAGLSGVMRESPALARPVVCTDVGGNRELVRDGATGRPVAPGDAAAQAAVIGDLLVESQGARAMAEAGRQLAVEKFSNAARARTMEELYRRLLAAATAS